MKTFHFSPRENKAHLIKWREWSPEAFSEARKEDKLVLLSISAVWCHWCHVMDEKAYSDERNINLINDRFIPIRVDTDKQPDVNRRFNMGGWPTTAVLTPDGELLDGTTYIPPEVLYNFLKEIDQIYHNNRDEIREQIEDFYLNREEEINVSIGEQELNQKIIEKITSMVLAEYDDQYGGFGFEPKFPHPEALNFLLDEYYRTKRHDLAEVLNKTLTSMASGGMFDQDMGGFFRYSTTRDFSIPHYEKMLEDNSRLLNIYLKAFQIFKDSYYKQVALSIISYFMEWLVDHETKTFYGSQDADEEYYAKKRPEREKLPPPYIDKTIYTGWNGLAISAFLRAFSVLQIEECKDTALKGLDFIWKNCFKPDEGMYHFFLEGKSFNTGLLEDQMHTINALLDAYEVTAQKVYLKDAIKLAELILARFYDKKYGGFYVDLPQFQLKRMNLKEKPLTINSCIAEMFLRLEVITGESQYRDVALKTLRLFSRQYPGYDLFAAPFGSAVAAYHYGFTHITIVGNYEDSKVREFVKESLKIYTPHKIVEELDPVEDRERITDLGYEPDKKRAYICKGQQCYPPVEEPEKIEEILVGK